MLLYIGKSGLAAGAFYLLFLALFQNKKQFLFNRVYLPVSLAISFLIPLITFTSVRYIETQTVNYAQSFAYLPEATIPSVAEPEIEWTSMLFLIYLSGLVLFLCHLLLGHYKAFRIVRTSKLREFYGTIVNVTSKDVHPFSFFNKIVLSEKTTRDPNLEMIVWHEQIHVGERHTIDILIGELLFLFQWFNPFAWLIKDAIKNNLEYLTDHRVTQRHNAEAYQLAMVRLADKKGVAPFLTALNGSQLKNRIIMMKQKPENKNALLKQLVVLPLLAVLIMG
ncbi:MAG: M56 family metallopeptidase, partial [Niabella sp.]